MISLPLLIQHDVISTPEIDQLLAENAAVAIGVSGGKDSCAVAFAVADHLDRIGHRGPRVLIHADLGVVEWSDSLPTCERLAARLGCELMIVRRPQGDMMDRWEQRWRDNLARYISLSCVRVILPWSTPSMRFCTSELKVNQITRGLKQRFPGQTIINVTGIRREESNDRKNAPAAAIQPKLSSVTLRTTGWDWNAIAHLTLQDVYAIARSKDFPLHEAYEVFGSRRVSCVYCILATEADHRVSASDQRNIPAGLRMVDLEIASTFAFQGNRWLGDTLRDWLSADQVTGIAMAKQRAAARERAEAKIPKDLLYTKGWPTRMPTHQEAELLAGVRREVGAALSINVGFTDAFSVRERYRELMDLKKLKARGCKRFKLKAGGAK